MDRTGTIESRSVRRNPQTKRRHRTDEDLHVGCRIACNCKHVLRVVRRGWVPGIDRHTDQRGDALDRSKCWHRPSNRQRYKINASRAGRSFRKPSVREYPWKSLIPQRGKESDATKEKVADIIIGAIE